MKHLSYSLLFALLGILLLPFLPAKAAPEPINVQETARQRDARMTWWRDARFGMFIHWGLYAEPAGVWNGKAYSRYGEWLMHAAKIPVADYKALATTFNPAQFDAKQWVTLAKETGMKYIVITAKHHDGFAMFETAADPFNIIDATPFKRDPLRELAAACREQEINLGFYYSQDQDWTAPGGGVAGIPWDKAQEGDFAQYFHGKAIPQMKELLSNYPGAPKVVWFDTPSKNMTHELAAEMVEVLKQHPCVIFNNRLGGGFGGDTETPEQYIPARGYPGRDWETCMTINGTWGFKKNDQNWKSTDSLLRNLINSASKGGNYLLNIGPTAEGTVPEPQIERLKTIGAWLRINGEAIYGTSATPFPRTPPWGRVTGKGDRLYLHIFNWPKDGKLPVPLANKVASARLLADRSRAFPAENTADGLVIKLPAKAIDSMISVVELKVDGPLEVLPTPPVAQGRDGSILLTAEDAVLMNKSGRPVTARLDGSGSTTHIGSWTDPEDAAQWEIRVDRPGKFQAVVNYSALAPAEFILGDGAASVTGSLAATEKWTTYHNAEFGFLELSQPGVLKLTLRRQNEAIRVCKITLKPVEPKRDTK